MKDAWDKLNELREHPELADTPGYGLEILRRYGDSVMWFLLLMEHPEFEPSDKWWYDQWKRADLPWARLLAAHPQFEKHCKWESVGRGELMTLAFLAPELFTRKFPEGRWHDLYAFLSPFELAGVLRDAPQAAEALDMDDVREKLAPDYWLAVLAIQPQLEKYFDWSKVEKRPSNEWDFLLRRQPQFADHCDFSQLRSDQLRRILMKQPQFLPRIDWSKLEPADREKLEAKGIKP
ncbi:MAG: hypothetical protein J6X69_01435 [Bacteroidales bacterium]|nr:hypothetical protein [Bacteroidales bacterium]